jgi:hypothetical protein
MFIMHFTRVERNSDEELFSPLPTFSTEDNFLKEYCLCAEEAEATEDISEFSHVHCNLTEPMVQCKSTSTPLATSLYQECHTNRRRKRAVDNDDVFEDTPLTYDSNYDPDYLPPVSLAYLYIYIYRISASMKVETDIIASSTGSPVGRVVKIYAETF